MKLTTVNRALSQISKSVEAASSDGQISAVALAKLAADPKMQALVATVRDHFTDVEKKPVYTRSGCSTEFSHYRDEKVPAKSLNAARVVGVLQAVIEAKTRIASFDIRTTGSKKVGKGDKQLDKDELAAAKEAFGRDKDSLSAQIALHVLNKTK